MDEQRRDDQLRTYIQQLCADTGCRLEDLPDAINDREGGEREPGISMLMVRHDDDDDGSPHSSISLFLSLSLSHTHLPQLPPLLKNEV